MARDIPRMRVLGYQATRPHLRVIQLPEEEVEPSPVPLNGATCGLDRGFARDGWIAFTPNEEVWGVPAPLEGRAFRVGRWWDCEPALNPCNVWLGNPATGKELEDAPSLYVEYDGVARKEVDRVEEPWPSRLEAVTPAGMVLRGRAELPRDELRLRDWSDGAHRLLPVHGWVVAARGPLIAVRSYDEGLVLYDTSTGRRTPVDCPTAGAWHHEAAFSPDGRWLACGASEETMESWYAERLPADAVQRRVPAWDFGDAGDMVELRRSSQRLKEPRWARIALIDVASGEVRLADGRVEDETAGLVWSADGTWLLFDCARSLHLCDVQDAGLPLLEVVRRRGRPTPCVDVTALLT